MRNLSGLKKEVLILSEALLLAGAAAALYLFSMVPPEPKIQERETQMKSEVAEGTSEVPALGVEVESTTYTWSGGQWGLGSLHV